MTIVDFSQNKRLEKKIKLLKLLKTINWFFKTGVTAKVLNKVTMCHLLEYKTRWEKEKKKGEKINTELKINC